MSEDIHVWKGDIGCYRLLDSGRKQKLEQIADITIARSEPRAWWNPSLSHTEWDKAFAIYSHEKGGGWNFRGQRPEDMVVGVHHLRLKVKFLKTSKHFGIFPEQSGQWDWIYNQVKLASEAVSVLNLFGYTGVSTLMAAAAGARVTHVDGSKIVLQWARENQQLSGLSAAPVRWILDDAVTFVKRELRRKKVYDGIIMDPPSYGRGPQGQLWKAEDQLVDLLWMCRHLLSDKPLFIILNMYSTDLSSLALKNLLTDVCASLGGSIMAGELALHSQGTDRLLPLSIFAIWSCH